MPRAEGYGESTASHGNTKPSPPAKMDPQVATITKPMVATIPVGPTFNLFETKPLLRARMSALSPPRNS